MTIDEIYNECVYQSDEALVQLVFRLKALMDERLSNPPSEPTEEKP